MIRSSLITLVLVLSTVGAQGGLVESFTAINSEGGKGPFGPNILQGSTGRVGVLQGHPSGGLQFQAAYRNEAARALAAQFNFYVANLFSTNYYELMGEYVYGDAFGSHGLDHAALLAKSSAALPKASSMLKHWVLEHHYVATNPSSKLARSFLLRGISDLQNERTFATHFFNFYLSAITDDYQFIPAYILAKQSPISDSAALEKARNDIASLYNSVAASSGERSAVALAVYKLRNAIHNQLSPLVVQQIDAFTKTYPGTGASTLASIRASIVAYYNVTPKKVGDLARAAGSPGLAAAADAIAAKGVNVDSLLALSKQAATLREGILSKAVPYAKKTAALVALFSASQYVSAELNKMATIPAAQAGKAMTAISNTLYSEGYLTQDHLNYFGDDAMKVNSSASAGAFSANLADIVAANIEEAFKPALAQWGQVKSGFAQGFSDNLVKSSALNTASTIVSKIK